MVGATRMNREQFAAATAGLDEAELRKALWTVYWRGTAAVRARIEEILLPRAQGTARPAAPPAPEPAAVLRAVQEFAALVRSGAYFAGSRAVSPKERSRWRFTFRRLLAESRTALADDDPAPGAAALTEMIELACLMRDCDYVRSEDPVEAAAMVVSDDVEALWRRAAEHHGFSGFAALAAGQFLRWDSRYGWSRRGEGTVSGRERTLTEVVAGLLTVPDTWAVFAEHYLCALDDQDRSTSARRRSEPMSDWHLLLVARFAGTEDENLLDRLVAHPALGGSERARLLTALADARVQRA